MLHVYISHAPADRHYVEQFMQWIQPLQGRYPFRVWFNHPDPEPEVAFPWNYLFFWYAPKFSPRPYNRNLRHELEQAHLYLFFTSPKSIKTPWIEQIEIPTAVERYQQHGSRLIRIYPVLIDPSQWKVQSRLAGFKTLGPVGRALAQVKPNEDGWFQLMEELRKVIPELRDNHIAHNKQLALPTGSFEALPAPWQDEPEKVVPVRNWPVWIVVIALAVWSVYWVVDDIRPWHKEYWPKKEKIKSGSPVPNLPAPTLTPMPRVDTLTPTGGRIRDPK